MFNLTTFASQLRYRMQYFYDENGQRIVDPAEQKEWVKKHPDKPFGMGVPMGDGPLDDPPEPIVDT